jgi:hypothetical protein
VTTLGALGGASFDWPWFLGNPSAPSSTVPRLLPVALGGRPYLIDLTKYKRTTLQVRRVSTDESVEPGEQSLNAAGVWKRSQSDWFLGAGQEYLDNMFAFVSVYEHSGEYPSVRTRFWRSIGVDPWTQGTLKLQPAATAIRAATGRPILLAVGSGYLYSADGGGLLWNSSPSTSSSWTAVTIAGGAVPTSITTDGYRVWAAIGSGGVVVTNVGATTSSAAATPPALTAPTLLYEVATSGSVGANLAPSTSYDYAVTAVDCRGGETTASAVVTAAESGTAYPITLSWGTVSGTGITYNLYKATHSGTLHQLATGLTTTSYVDNGLVATNSVGTPASNLSGTIAYPATKVGYALGWLIGSTGRDLVSINADGSTTPIWTHPNPQFTWDVIREAPGFIIVTGHAGPVCEIHAVALSTQTETLAPPIWASSIPRGEIINDVAYNAGSLVLATSEGIRTSTPPSSTGTFDINPVITAPGPVNCVTAWDRFAYFGWSDYDAADTALNLASTTTYSGLGRLDLSQFTTQGVSAYATDVMVSGQTATTTSVAVVGGVPYFGLAGLGVYGASTSTYVASGYVETGWVRYGTVESKVLVSLDLKHDALTAGQSVVLNVYDQFGNLSDSVTSSTVGSLGPATPQDTGLLEGDQFMVQITLNAGASNTTTPTFRRWTSRSMVVPLRQDEILLPIVLKEEVNAISPGGQPIHFDPAGEFAFLKNLEAAGLPVSYQELGSTHQVYIDQVQVAPEQWTSTRDWFQGIVTVKLITLT